jgi:hypothetical protein
MSRQRILVVIALAFAVALGSTRALADMVLLLPAKGQVPGSMLGSILENETRYAVIEVGHKLVEPEETQAAIRQVADGVADDADEFALLARVTKAEWVVSTVVFPQEKVHRLEITAFRAKDGRSESVTRDMDVSQVHQYVVDMLRVLLRAEGVGTAALPWEAAPRSLPSSGPKGGGKGGAADAPGGGPKGGEAHPLFVLGAGVGVASAVKRPDNASGETTSVVGALRAGISPLEPVDIALGFRDHFTGPRALSVDLSARYLFPVAPALKLAVGPEIAPGVFVTRGGSQSTSFMFRGTVVAGVRAARMLSVEAHLGDLTVVPASAGTLLLAGGSVHGLLRF